MQDVIDASRKAVLDQLRGGDGALGLKILERTVPDLMPAPNRIDLGGPGGTGLASLAESAMDRLKSKLAAMAKRQAGDTTNGHGKAVTS